jgi:YhcN/YlaJ family sporulation lipoprotein
MIKSWLFRSIAASMAFIFILTGCTWNDASDNGVKTKSINDRANRPYGVNRLGVQTPPTLMPSLRPDTTGVMHENANLVQDQRTANKLTKMNEISQATVLLSKDNAYVGVKLNTPIYGGQSYMGTPNRQLNGMDTINAGLHAKITRKVKDMNPTIKNVYVSASPDFLNTFNGYADQITRGNPVRSFISQFNDAMRKSFPITTDHDHDADNRVWK